MARQCSHATPPLQEFRDETAVKLTEFIYGTYASYISRQVARRHRRRRLSTLHLQAPRLLSVLGTQNGTYTVHSEHTIHLPYSLNLTEMLSKDVSAQHFSYTLYC